MMRSKLLILLASLFLGVSTLFATDNVIFMPSNFAGQGSSMPGSAISATIDGVTISCDHGQGYSNKDIRCYKGSVINVTSTRRIKELHFFYTDNMEGGLQDIYANVYLEGDVWTRTLNSQARITCIVVSFYESTLTDNNFALTGAPVNLSFDLRETVTPQVIHYTTSSSGEVEVSDNYYINAEVNSANKTITITPKTKLTQEPVTVYVCQKADGSHTYGYASFTVSITGDKSNIHTCTFYVNGAVYQEREFATNADVEFPDNPDDIYDKTFYGWIWNYQINEETTSAPQIQTYVRMFEYDMKFYAVFADELAPGTLSWYTTNVTEPEVYRPRIDAPAIFEVGTTAKATITCATAGAEIYYRLGDSGSWKKYVGPVSVTTTTTLYAKAVKNNKESRECYLPMKAGVATPTFTFGNEGVNQVFISCATPGADIYYTTNYSTPTTASPKYTGAITACYGRPVQAIAVKNGVSSDIASIDYDQVMPLGRLQGYATDKVAVKGFITGIANERFFIQDQDAGVVASSYSSPAVSVGDEVLVIGKLELKNGFSSIDSPSFKVLSQGNKVEPTLTTVKDLETDYQGDHKLYGKRIRMKDQRVRSANNTFGSIYGEMKTSYILYGIRSAEFTAGELIDVTCNAGELVGSLMLYCDEPTYVGGTVTIPSTFATFTRRHAADLKDMGVKVFTAKVVNNQVKLQEIENAFVPANTPVILYSSTPLSDKVYSTTSKVGSPLPNNDLQGAFESSYIPATTDGMANYYLKVENGVPMFVRCEDTMPVYGGEAILRTSVDAAMLPVEIPASVGVESLIAETSGNICATTWFTLDGKQLPARPSRPGIYLRRTPQGFAKIFVR